MAANGRKTNQRRVFRSVADLEQEFFPRASEQRREREDSPRDVGGDLADKVLRRLPSRVRSSL
jgi:hypothetical protein